MKKLRGLYTAIITPFTKGNKIDYPALEKIITQQIKANVDGIVILGTTGECETLDTYEKHKIIEFTQNIINDTNICLIIGTGSNNTINAINEIKGLSGTNGDYFLVSCPSYIKPTDKGLLSHFTKIANESYKPIILYNNPSRTGINISINTLKTLSQHPNIVGIKDAGNDINYSLQLCSLISKEFTLLSGNDNLAFSQIIMGYSGIISVLSNALPYEMKYYISCIQKNDINIARIIQQKLLNIMNDCFIETNPIPIKYIMNKLGFCKNKLRLPLTTLSTKNKIKIYKTLNDLNVL